MAPLMQEINDLVAAQDKDLELARGRAADLAHGLKTPLSALASDVSVLRARGENDIAGRIEQVGEAMRRHIEHELARARIRGKRGFRCKERPLSSRSWSPCSIQRRTSAGERLISMSTLTEPTLRWTRPIWLKCSAIFSKMPAATLEAWSGFP